MHVHRHVMLRCCVFSCNVTHTHRVGGVGWGWDNNVSALAFSCTSTDTSCYAAVFSHALPHIRHGVGWGGIITSMHLRSHARPQTRHATLLCFLMHCHTYVMGWGGVGWDNNVSALAFSCTFTDASCYAAVFSHALPHIRDGVGWGGIITSVHLRISCTSHRHLHAYADAF